MSDFSLFGRFSEFGTLSETDFPESRFALASTINWMRALAILVAEEEVSYSSARSFYKKTQKIHMEEARLNSVYEQTLFALHQISSLKAISTAPNKADVSRLGIIAWYYGINAAAAAMIAASEGKIIDAHMPRANHWDSCFAAKNLVLPPFNLRVSELLIKTVDSEVEKIKSERGTHSLKVKPQDSKQAWGACAEYLSGTSSWIQNSINEDIKERPEFRKLGVSNFKSKAAIVLRDAAYKKRAAGFLHQAIRYRGKANYRDVIYLGYGKGTQTLLSDYVTDLISVLAAFSSMSAGYVSLRVGKEKWEPFVGSLESSRAFSTSPADVWS